MPLYTILIVYRMSKRAISVTLHSDNLTWLKARAGAIGVRSVSELLDQLVAEARRTTPRGAVRSVVGTIDIDASDPLLEDADDVLRTLFDTSLKRPTLVKDARAVRRGEEASCLIRRPSPIPTLFSSMPPADVGLVPRPPRCSTAANVNRR